MATATIIQRIKFLFTGKIHCRFDKMPDDSSNWVVWYNKDKGWFEVYDTKGNEVRCLREVNISDNWTGTSNIPLSITFNVLGFIVEQKPTPHV